MKYYAVTDDPNELIHWGIKGMKWGVRRTDAQLGHPRHTGSKRPRSAAYKRAQSKLSASMRNGIKAVEAKWKAYNSPVAKEERFMKKAMQKARTGTLKYGKLTDDQVNRVTERLYLERQARQLGSTENPRFLKRVKSAVGTGIVEGLGRGTASYLDERFRGRGRTTAEIKAQKRKEKYESKGSTLRRKANKAADEEYYREMAENGGAEGRVRSMLRIGANTAATAGKTAYAGIGALAGLQTEDEAKEIFRTGMGYNRTLTQNMTRASRTRVMRQKRAADKEEERTKRQEELREKSYYTHLGKIQAENFGKTLNPGSGSSSSSSSATSLTTSKPSHPIKAPSGDRGIVSKHVPRRTRKITRVDLDNPKRPGGPVSDWQTLSRRSGESMEDYANRVDRSRRRTRRR